MQILTLLQHHTLTLLQHHMIISTAASLDLLWRKHRHKPNCCTARYTTQLLVAPKAIKQQLLAIKAVVKLLFMTCPTQQDTPQHSGPLLCGAAVTPQPC